MTFGSFVLFGIAALVILVICIAATEDGEDD